MHRRYPRDMRMRRLGRMYISTEANMLVTLGAAGFITERFAHDPVYMATSRHQSVTVSEWREDHSLTVAFLWWICRASNVMRSSGLSEPFL